jgi:D-alanyl-D-alanine dipeptidase
MWKQLPDANYVADPKKGSLHNRGGAVDVSLLGPNGREVDMGTAFDAFTPLAWHTAEDLSEEAKKNRLLLKSVMEQCGFKALKSEWWHYHLPDISTYPIENKKWLCH